MTLTTHALVGVAAASLFPHAPYAAFAAGFVSHFAIDALPHWDYVGILRSVEHDESRPLDDDMRIGRDFVHDLAIIVADGVLGALLAVAAGVWLLGATPELALVGAGAGVFPDLLQFVYYKIRRTPLEPALHYLQIFHRWVQKGKGRHHWPTYKGIGYQALLVAGALLAARLSLI